MNDITKAKISKIAEDLAKEKYKINGIERLFMLFVLSIVFLYFAIHFVIFLIR